MTDVLKLISAESSVRLLADRAAADDLAKLAEFWSGNPAKAVPDDLSSVSDAELRSRLAREGIETGMPETIHAIAEGRLGRNRRRALALAACLAASGAMGLGWWVVPRNASEIVDSEPAEILDDALVFARPDRPAPEVTAPGLLETEQPQGMQPAPSVAPASVDRTTRESGLTRVEIYEMQRLLNRLGYGPLHQNGLASEALFEAASRFHADDDSSSGSLPMRDVLVRLRQAARIEALRPRREEETPIIEETGD